MKIIELETGTYTETDVQFMSLEEVIDLGNLVQSEIFKIAKQKKEISTLPKCKKDMKTLKKYSRLSTRLLDLQDAACWIGKIRKKKRDSMSKEKQWLHKFYKLAETSIRKSQFEKLVEQTNVEMQYSIG